jgi:cell division protein FtsL
MSVLALVAVSARALARRGQHASRGAQPLHELQRLTRERDELDIEWGQLQLEQSTWATHGRVERVARDDLRMVIPQASDLRIVQP